MQAEINNGIVDRSFFGQELYPPLIPKEKQSCCKSLASWNCIKASGVIAGTALAGTLTYIAIDCMKGMIEAPPSSLEFAYNATILGLETVVLSTASCVGLIACGVFKWGQNRITKQFPHLQNYQGSLITPFTYYFRHFSLENENLSLPFIEACFKDLEQKGLFEPWFKINNFETREEAARSIFTSLQKGTCYGHSMALLAMMLKAYDASSQELMDKLDLQKIVYFQIMMGVLVSLCNGKGWKEIRQAMIEREWNIEMCDENNIYSTTFWLLALLNLDSHKILFNESDHINIATINSNELKEFFKSHFDKMKEMQNQDIAHQEFTLAGMITLSNNEKSSHALFYQFSEKHYRFHDSGSQLTGFFEFETEDQFFEALLNHVNKSWPKYKDGRLGVTVLGIPQKPAGKNSLEGESIATYKWGSDENV